MPDFMLEPEEIEPTRWSARPGRLVSSGLAPTAEVPKQRRGPTAPDCAQPCESCGTLVLLGRTGDGTRVALDIQGPRCYTVLWDSGAAEPLCAESRAYPQHQCQAGRVA